MAKQPLVRKIYSSDKGFNLHFTLHFKIAYRDHQTFRRPYITSYTYYSQTLYPAEPPAHIIENIQLLTVYTHYGYIVRRNMDNDK